MNNSARVDEQKYWGREGYPFAEIDRSGKLVSLTIKGNGISFPFHTIREAQQAYILLSALGNRLYEVLLERTAQDSPFGCTCERGADLDHWSRCDVHGKLRGK